MGQHAYARGRRLGALLLLAICLPAPGCIFSQKSFKMSARDVVRVPPAGARLLPRLAARAWLARTHEQLRGLLPGGGSGAALTTDGLCDGPGRPIDVYRRFGVDPAGLQKLLSNWGGVCGTAQCSGREPAIDFHPPAWPGFEQVWVPINEQLNLSGRLGLVRKDGQPVGADCIVILPGFFGDNNSYRCRDLARGLLECGFHVLSLEPRGHGQTEARYPDVPYTFGIEETADLLAVAAWLEAQPAVRRTGLIGFSWGANHALLVARYESHRPTHPSIAPRLRALLPPGDGRRHFRAGVIACSAVPDFERFIDRLDIDKTLLNEPVLAAIQDMVRHRVRRKGYPPIGGKLRRLIELEASRSPIRYPGYLADGHDFLRLLPHEGKPTGDKLASVRMPVLVLEGANDPMGTAQEVADLVATTGNPNFSALILPRGGHVGFSRYAPGYYLSLLVNFFGAETGPVGVDPATTSPEMRSDKSGALGGSNEN